MKNKFIYVLFAVTALLFCFIFSASAGFDISELDEQTVLEIGKVESLDECFAQGDTDDSGSIDAADARFILRVAVHLENIDASDIIKVDIDGDGAITAADARIALRMAVGLDEIPAHEIEDVVISKATCHSDGLAVKICKSCLKVYAVYEPSKEDAEHVAGGIEVVLPTCVDKGYYQRKCTVCDEVIIYRETEPTGIHVYGEWTYPNGNSCETSSDMVRTCKFCGDISKKIDPAGHSFKWIAEQKVSCTEDGLEVYKCSDCGIKGTPANNGKAEIVTKAWGHRFAAEYTVTKEATCTEDGIKAKLCGFCGLPEEELAVPATGHDIKNAIIETVNEANCCEEGLRKVICPVCREFEEEIIPVTEHDVENGWTIDEPAACTEDGSKTGYCNYCRKDVTVVIPAMGHTVQWANVEAPSCSEYGLKSGDCSVCGEIGVTERIDKLPHEFNYNVYWWLKDSGTTPCKGIWKGYYQCKNCDEKEYKDDFAQVSCSSKLGNDSVLTKTVSEATCTAAEMIVEICQYCNEALGEVRANGDPIPHSYDGLDWTVTKEADCEEPGEKSMSCNYNCGTVKTEAIPANGHSYGDFETDIEPDCVTPGKEKRICSVCFDEDEKEIPANGHTPGEFVEDEKATCSKGGTEVQKCTVCSELLATRETDKAAHTPKTVIVADTGELVDGNYVVKCKVICDVCNETLSEEATFNKIFVNSDEELTVEFSVLPADLKAGDKVEFTVTDVPEGAELLVFMSMPKVTPELLIAEDGVYSFTVPEGLSDTDSIIILVQIANQ